MIDWTKPIEAVNGNIIIPVTLDYIAGGLAYTKECPNDAETNEVWELNGADMCDQGLWYVRNAQPKKELDPTATWWAKRWWQSATDAEKEAMRVLVGSE